MDITVAELKEKLDKKEDFIFIDVREPHEYQEVECWLGKSSLVVDCFIIDY